MPAPIGHEPYSGCETGGRPTIYTDEFIENEANLLIEWMKNPKNIWFESFAVERGYHPNRMLEWSKKNEKFSWVYELTHGWQKAKLISGGLVNVYNSNVLKLVMANVFDWSEKKQVTNESTNAVANILGEIDGDSTELVRKRKA